MATGKIIIFLTGVTGYIGATVLSRLLLRPDVASFEISALVRSAERAEKLQTLGVKTILGSYDQLETLTEAASHADIVITMANADNLAAAEAILKGMKIKYEASGKQPILIHTSGTAFIIDDARGLHGDHRVYSDLESEVLNALPVTAIHRNVDVPLMEADSKAGYVKSYIVTPATIFGHPSGRVAELGLQNTHSHQIPAFIKASIIRKKGAYFGKGLNQWPAVDINDTADVYMILLDTVLKSPDSIGHGLEGYYFVENLQYSAMEIAQTIAEALVDNNVASTPETSPFTLEEGETYFGKFWPLFGTNAYAKGERTRALGWVPKRGKEDFIAYVKSEVAFYVKQERD